MIHQEENSTYWYFLKTLFVAVFSKKTSEVVFPPLEEALACGNLKVEPFFIRRQ